MTAFREFPRKGKKNPPEVCTKGGKTSVNYLSFVDATLV